MYNSKSSNRFLPIVLCALFSVTACHGGGGHSSSPPVQSKAQEPGDSQPQTKPAESSDNRATAANESDPAQVQTASEASTPPKAEGLIPVPAAIPEEVAGSQKKEDEDRFSKITRQMATTLNVGALALGAAIHPDENTTISREALADVRKDSSEGSDKNIVNLRNRAIQTTPESPETIEIALNANDEPVEQLLQNLMVEKDREKVLITTSNLVDEILNEPEIASAKIAEVQLGLQKINAAGLYNYDLKTRVAYLQAALTQRIHADHLADQFRDAFVIGASSAALGTLAGLQIPQKAYGYIENPARLGIGSAWRTARGTVSTGLTTTAERVSSLLANAKRAIGPKLSPEQIAERDLIKCGLNHDQIAGLGLTSRPRGEVGNVLWSPTQVPGLKFDLRHSLGDETPKDDVVLVFKVRNHLGMVPRPYVTSKFMSEEDARALIKTISYDPATSGEQKFIAVIDQSTGETYPTNIRAPSLPQITDPEIMSAAAENGQTALDEIAAEQNLDEHLDRSLAEARADGIVPLETAEPQSAPPTSDKLGSVRRSVSETATNAKQHIADMGNKVAGLAHSAADRTSAVVVPVLKRFDSRLAATVGLSSTAAMYGIYEYGFDRGSQHGQDNQGTYLESLIQPESLKRVSVAIPEPLNVPHTHY